VRLHRTLPPRSGDGPILVTQALRAGQFRAHCIGARHEPGTTSPPARAMFISNEGQGASMHISNDRYFRERRRHDLALRMIRHQARTCTIKSCTGLTDDRIRRLCKAYAVQTDSQPVRRRGKSPRRIGFFTRNAQLLFESACLTSIFCAFGLLRPNVRVDDEEAWLEFGTSFCDAFETYRQLSAPGKISFEHAWFLLQQLNEGHELKLTRCRQCQGQYLSEAVAAAACPTCRLKKAPLRDCELVSRKPLRLAPNLALANVADRSRTQRCYTRLVTSNLS
jgi:hypothetical protein